MRFLPVFLDLQSGVVLLVGAGELVRAKLRLLASAGANKQHRSGLQVEKDWQESHAALVAPTCGVD